MATDERLAEVVEAVVEAIRQRRRSYSKTFELSHISIMEDNIIHMDLFDYPSQTKDCIVLEVTSGSEWEDLHTEKEENVPNQA